MIAERIEPDIIDRIFANSTGLNADAIQDFVRSLCEVSKDEIMSEPPRLFSLQKLVELAHFNMGRIRIVWSRIWKMLAGALLQKKNIFFFFGILLSDFFFPAFFINFFFHCCLIDHFTIVGCDLRPQVSMYAIDSLKQLAMKFLEKEELAHYHFQKEFLKPFETIMQNNSNVKIRYAMKIKFGSFSAKKKKILKKNI